MADKTFEEFRKEITSEGAQKGYSLEDWDKVMGEVKESKTLSDTDRARLEKAIGYAVENRREAGEVVKTEAEPEVKIIHDAMPSAKRGEKVIAVAKKSEGVKYLGYIAGFTVGACTIPNEVVKDFWKEKALPAWTQPNEAHPKDAFARACMTLKRDEVKQVEKGQIQCSWNVSGLKSTEYMITRKIVIEDEDGKRDLGWQNIARLVLEGEGEDVKAYKVVVKPEAGVRGLATICEGIQKEVRETYQTYMENVVDKQVRDALRNTIQRANGIGFTMGRGGAWFVPLDAQPIIEGWREFTAKVNGNYTTGGYPVSIRLIPLADEMEFQSMVKEDVEREVKERMESILNETLEALDKAGTKTENAEEREKALDKILVRKMEAHADTIGLLEQYKDLLHTSININLKSLNEKLDKVETPLSARHQTILRKLATLEAQARTEKAVKTNVKTAKKSKVEE